MRRAPAAERGGRGRAFLVRAFAGLLALAVALCALAVFPYPLFSHQRQLGSLDLRSDAPPGPGIDEALQAAHDRVLAMPLHLPHARYGLFLCHRERLYGLFSFLTRKPPVTQGLIVSSATETVVLSASGIRRMRERTGGEPLHSRLEGSLDAAIAHEVAHVQVRRHLGLRRSILLPAWKSEGWADYSAHRGPLRSDPGGGLAARIRALLDDAAWREPLTPVDRRHYGWQLLVEYLVEVEGMSFATLMAEDVTEADCRARQLAWYAGSEPEPTPS